MGTLVMIIGKSGSGKSTSIRNFKKGEVGILNVAGKRLPFKNDLEMCNNPNYDICKSALKGNNFNAYIIDDSTYLMQLQNFELAKVKGYEKFTEMAYDFEQLLKAARETNDDTIVYFLHHPQFADDGSCKPQTIGKMLDNQLCVEGLFPIVLECTIHEGKHVFCTENETNNIAKAPLGMFADKYIDNDLKSVDTIIRDYWGMAPLGKKAVK